MGHPPRATLEEGLEEFESAPYVDEQVARLVCECEPELVVKLERGELVQLLKNEHQPHDKSVGLAFWLNKTVGARDLERA